MFQYFILYLATVPAFVVLDLLWLGVVAKSYYQTRLAHLLGPVEWYAAVVFYLVFILGVLVFVVMPALQKGSFMHVVLFGFLFGIVTYATYDLTNLATLRDWPVGLTIVDIVWGGFLSMAVASWSYLIATKFLGLG